MAQPSSTPRRRPRGSLPTWLSIAIVTVLVLAVAGLSWLAITRTQTPPPAETPRVTPTIGVVESTTTPTPTPTPTPTATVAAATGPDERFLAASTGVLWRATAGQCGSVEPLLERSTDAGATWTDVTPRYLGIGQILAVSPYTGDQAQLVALMGADCALQGMRTFTDGQFWEPNGDILASATYVDPGDPVAIVSPAGTLDAPCATPTGVRAGGGTTALVCGSDASQSTDAAGWTPIGQTAVLAVAVAADGTVATARADAASCTGLIVTGPDGEDCFEGAPSDAPVALALDGDGAPWLWSGDVFDTIP